jgi:biotin carboxyl carrier protein
MNMAETDPKPRFSNIVLDGVTYKTVLPQWYKNKKKYEPANPKLIKAYIPGTIIKVMTRRGRKVEEGDNLLLLEAMKMQTYVQAHISGKVKKVNIKKGQMVSKGFVMIELE